MGFSAFRAVYSGLIEVVTYEDTYDNRLYVCMALSAIHDQLLTK